jgi:hypothetical protein
LTIATGAPGVAIGLTLKNATPEESPGYNSQSDVTNVVFRGFDGYPPTATIDYWGTALNLTNVSNINITNDQFQGPFGLGGYSTSGIGVAFSGLPSSMTYAGVINVLNSSFNLLNVGMLYGSYIQGVTVSQSNFTGCEYGIASNSSETGVLSELQVTNSQFNCRLGIALSAGIDGVGIANNLVLVPDGGIGIDLSGTSIGLSITGNTFDGIGAGAVGINAMASNALNIVGNQFSNFTGRGYGLVVGAPVANVSVQSNIFTKNKNNILNSSLTAAIQGNPGYNPVGLTAAANVGASPAVVVAGASPETHYLNQSATNTATVKKPGATSGGACSGNTIATLVGSSIYYPIQLGPNESYCVTWSTTQPTYTKDVH